MRYVVRWRSAKPWVTYHVDRYGEGVLSLTIDVGEATRFATAADAVAFVARNPATFGGEVVAVSDGLDNDNDTD